MRDCIRIPQILLPNVKDMSKWAVIACDQFTSDRSYWKKLEADIGDAPSALKLTLPEIYLSDGNVDERISSALAEMRKYVSDGTLSPIAPGFILVERTTALRAVPRFGLMLAIDLEEFSLDGKSGTAIRPSEATVAERLPARVRMRRGAPIELPHAMLLYDDKENFVLGDVIRHRESYEKVYDFSLNMNGGHVTGYFIPYGESVKIKERFYYLAEKNGNGLLFTVGDGNHSIASAKQYWDERQDEDDARYFLTEVVNIYDPALSFGPIHRLVCVSDKRDFLNSLETYVGPFNEKENIVRFGGFYNQIEYITKLDSFIKAYVDTRGGYVDYLSGESYVKRLVSGDNTALGIVLNPIDRSVLFPTIINGGIFPRKTFAMVENIEKRYYLEARML